MSPVSLMRHVLVSALRPGQVLAAPVTNLHGQVLLAQGVTLSARQITTLKAWGVDSVAVVAEAASSPTASATPPEETLRQATLAVDLVFRGGQLGHPLLEELYRLAIVRQLKRLETP